MENTALATRSNAVMRQCLLTKQEAAKSELWRFVLSPDEVVTFDVTQRLPGRGAWLIPEANALQQAVQKKLFSKAFKQNAHVPDDLLPRMAVQLKDRLLAFLSLARKAGQAVAGAQKVVDFTHKHPNCLVFIAGDGSVQTVNEWRHAMLLHGEGLTAAELGGIFSRDIAVVIAVQQGNLQDDIKRCYQQWRGLAALT